MLAAIGAASTIFDALKSLSSSASSTAAQTTTGFAQSAATFSATTTSSMAISAPLTGGGSGTGNLSPDTIAALFAAQDQSGARASQKTKAGALNDLFGLLDADGSGGISKSEFEQALGAGGTNLAAADNVFDKIDKNGDGSVSADELASALTASRRSHGHHHAGGAKGGGNADPLMQALRGASTTTASNSDGSSTTTVTYADGSKVTMTSPPSNATASAATSSYNFVEQAIQRQAQAIAAATTASLSTSV